MKTDPPYTSNQSCSFLTMFPSMADCISSTADTFQKIGGRLSGFYKRVQDQNDAAIIHSGCCLVDLAVELHACNVAHV